MASKYHESLTDEQANEFKSKTRILTPTFRISWPKLFKAEQYGESDPKYSLEMIFPKNKEIICTVTGNQDTTKIETVPFSKVEKYALALRLGTNNKKWPPLTFFKDGDTDPKLSNRIECKNMWVGRASSAADQPPDLIDLKGRALTSENDLPAGCYARAELSVYYFFHPKFKTHHLLAQVLLVQKIRDGERLDGRKKTDISRFAVPAEELGDSESSSEFDEAPASESENEDYGFLS